jgi:hypothetical protein
MPMVWPYWAPYDPPQHIGERNRKYAERLTHGPGKRKNKRKKR